MSPPLATLLLPHCRVQIDLTRFLDDTLTLQEAKDIAVWVESLGHFHIFGGELPPLPAAFLKIVVDKQPYRGPASMTQRHAPDPFLQKHPQKD